MSNYEVVVGNIGTVYSGADKKEAVKNFHVYVEQATAGIGRASGESVVLLEDDEILAESESKETEDNA